MSADQPFTNDEIQKLSLEFGGCKHDWKYEYLEDGNSVDSWYKCKHCGKETYTPPEDRYVRLARAFLATLKDLADERQSHSGTLDARDRAQAAADRLAYALFGIEDIGEHSSANDPWENAAERLEDMAAGMAELPNPAADHLKAVQPLLIAATTFGYKRAHAAHALPGSRDRNTYDSEAQAALVELRGDSNLKAGTAALEYLESVETHDV